MKHLRRTLFLLLCVPLLAHGQVLRLAQQQTGATKVMAAPGDTITVEVMADVGVQTASGLRFFVKVPRDDFIILETTGQQLKRTAPSPPFKQGRLFEGAVEIRNDMLSASDPTMVDKNWQMMEYAALLGPAPERGRSGSGVVAIFRVVCPPSPVSGSIAIHQDPIHETRLFMADGVTEKSFFIGSPLSIHVKIASAVQSTGWAEAKLQRSGSEF